MEIKCTYKNEDTKIDKDSQWNIMFDQESGRDGIINYDSLVA